MKKIILFSSILLLTAIMLSGVDFQALMGKYIDNQHRVKSLVASGSVTIKITNAQGKSLSEISSKMTIFMKAPNLFKLSISDPSPSTIVQKGNLMTQKLGNGPAVTNKVTESSDLFRKYFAYDIDKNFAPSNIARQWSVSENGATLYVFSLSMGDAQARPEGRMASADKAEIYLNESGMIVRQVLFGKDTELVRTETHYTVRDGISIADRIVTKMSTGGMLMENTIAYGAISVNTVVSDKEFELK